MDRMRRTRSMTLAKSTCGGPVSRKPKSAPRLASWTARAADQRLTWRTAEVDAGPASQPPLRHGDAVADRCGRQCGDQPGWTSAEDHEIVVAAGRVLPFRRVALIDRALVVFIRW